MPHKDLAKRRAYLKQYQRMRIEQNRRFLRAVKNKPCTDCGEFYPYYVMQFDHVRGKSFTISSRSTAAINSDKLLEEVSKCEVVCANCHAERTHVRRLKKMAA